MIQQRTVLKVSDNSGAKTVRCFKVLGGFRKKYAKLGDIIVVSVQQLRNKAKNTSKVKKKEVYKALVIRTKTKHVKKDGSELNFQENSVVLINKQGEPIGTRIIGPIPKALRKKKLQKFISIASGQV
jgi:large subunit ribosomal protein L14